MGGKKLQGKGERNFPHKARKGRDQFRPVIILSVGGRKKVYNVQRKEVEKEERGYLCSQKLKPFGSNVKQVREANFAFDVRGEKKGGKGTKQKWKRRGRRKGGLPLIKIASKH